MVKNRILILFTLILLLAGLIVVSSSPKTTQTTQPPSRTLSPGNPSIEPQITLSLTPSSQEVVPEEQFSVSVFGVSTKEILAIDLHLSYDPNLIDVQSIKPGTIFTNPMVFKQTIDSQKGTILFALGSLTLSKKSGTLATFTFKAKQNSKSLHGEIALIEQKLVASVKGAQKARITVSDKALYTIGSK